MRPVSTSKPYFLSLLTVAVLSMCAREALGVPARPAAPAFGDTERIALDPELARKARLQTARECMETRQYRDALSAAKYVIAGCTDPSMLTEAEEIVIRATRQLYGCKEALSAAERLRATVKHQRPESADEVKRLDEQIAELKDDLATYQEALAGRRKVMEEHPGTAQAAESAYRIARLACWYGTKDEAVSALRQVIAQFASAEEQLTSRPNAAVVAEAVMSIKDVCLVRGGPEEAIEELEPIAASHVLDEAGAHAYLHIGEIHRTRGETEAAERAYVMVDRLYPSTSVAYTAMMYAGDMWDDVVHIRQTTGDQAGLIAALRKSYDCYPQCHRKYEAAYVAAYYMIETSERETAYSYLDAILATMSPELADLREQAKIQKAVAYCRDGEYEQALNLLVLMSPAMNDAARKREVRQYIESITRRLQGDGATGATNQGSEQ